MQNIFRSTLVLSVLIGCFSARPVVAGGDSELASLDEAIRTQHSLPNLTEDEVMSLHKKMLETNGLNSNQLFFIAPRLPEQTLYEDLNLAISQEPISDETITTITRLLKMVERLAIPKRQVPEDLLAAAIKKNDAKILELFINYGFNKNVHLTETETTPLQYAANNYASISFELLSAKLGYSEKEQKDALDNALANQPKKTSSRKPIPVEMRTSKSEASSSSPQTSPIIDVTVQPAQSSLITWGISASAVAAVGTFAALIARRLMLQK